MHLESQSLRLSNEMAPVSKRLFGKTREGEPVYAYQLDDGKIKAEVFYLLYITC